MRSSLTGMQTMQSTKHAKTGAEAGDRKKPSVTTEETARPLNARELSLYKRVIWRSSMSPTLKSLAIAADTSALRARLMLEHIRHLEAAALKSMSAALPSSSVTDVPDRIRKQQKQPAPLVVATNPQIAVQARNLAEAEDTAPKPSRIPRSPRTPRTPQRQSQSALAASVAATASPRDLPPALYAYSGLPHPICLSSTFEGAPSPIVMPIAPRRPPSSGAQSRASHRGGLRRAVSIDSIGVDRRTLATDEATRAWGF